MIVPERKTVNPAGNPTISNIRSGRLVHADNYGREDFLSDLKKVVKKLPPDHPSRSGSEKR